MDWEAAAAAIRGANGLDSGNIYQNYANAGVINAAPAQFVGRQKAIQADNEERARKESIAIEQKKKAMEDDFEASKKDPGKAYMELGEDGRYKYFNGAGEMLNINQFSLLTGKRPDEILADSENPDDQKFVSDYQTMKQFASAWVNGDNETLQKFRQADPEKYNQLVSTYKTPGEMVKGFRDYYSDYYGSTNGDQSKADRFSMSSKAGIGDDPKGKALKAVVGASPLDQTLAPINMQEQPKDPGFIGDLFHGAATYGPGALVGGGTLWGKSKERTAYEDSQERLKRNPWMQYNNYLRGM